MKKFYFLLVLAFLYAGLKAQPVMIYSENFDISLDSLTRSPNNRWVLDSSLKSSYPYAMKGLIPSHLGDSVELITDWIDARPFSHLLLSFQHICKVSESDLVTVEYELNRIGSRWTKIPMSSYIGMTSQYKGQKFSQRSYADWKYTDSLARPTNDWWKTETFDLSAEAGWEQFRLKFKIKRGTTVGTQFAYGWLIDNIQLLGANAQIKLPEVSFLAPLIPDTVFSTGPFVVNAKVATRTIAPIIHPVLRISYTYNMITILDSIIMTDQDGGDSLWTATIPQQRFGTLINYYIVGKDTGGNEKTISSATYLKRFIPDSVGGQGIVEMYTDARNGGSYVMPFDITYTGNWTRQIYPASEFNGRSGMITKIGWRGYYDSYTGVANRKNVKIYFEEVSYTALTSTAYVNPNTLTNATLVFDGEILLDNGYRPWNDVILSTPYFLTPGSNLLVHVYDNSGFTCNGTNSSGTTYYAFTYKATTYNSGVYCRSATGTGTVNNYGTHTRFTMASGTADSNAVAMYAIESPNKSVIAGQSTPVKVTISNNGFKDLTSCVINWSVNGTLQTPYHWTGMLPDDWKDTGIVIGSYIPRNELYDTVVVWVGMPNGVLDSVNVLDDTLRVITYGCINQFSGDYVIGNQSGADFTSFNEALKILENCGANGDITFKFQSGTYGPLTIGDLKEYIGNYSLTITSVTGNAEDVVFERTSGTYAVNISGTQNIILRNVTIENAITNATAATYALLLSGNLTNIEIRDCQILMDTTVTSSYYYVIYKTSTGVLDGVRIINNVIRGGYYGVYLYGGSSTSVYGFNLVLDSNLIFGQYYYATYLYYADFNSISYNKIYSRRVNTTTYWYGLRAYYCNFNANGNIIRQLSNNISSPYLAYLYYIGYNNATRRSLFSNNEIIGYATGTYYGMYIYYGVLDVYNNSILLNGTTSGTRCIYIGGSNAYVTDCRNNNILNLSTGGFPIYVGTAGTYSGDYNNLYSNSSYVGYQGGNQTTLLDWINITGQDNHSVRLMPMFLGDSLQSLKLFDYSGMYCPVLPRVPADIEGTVRAGNTGIGAYTIYPTQLNAATVEAYNFNTSVILGQSAPLNVVIANMGKDSLVSVNMNWSVNGVLQTVYPWTGMLRTYDKDTFFLGNVTPLAGMNVVKVWTANPNQGVDDNPYNDTATFTIFGCDSLFSGTYNVGGVNADFADLTEAMESIKSCGLGGPTVLLLDTGTYSGMEIKEQIPGQSTINTLTFTSRSGNADDVRFVVDKGIALSLENVSHLVFKELTFDASAPSDGQGVNMKGRCVNIEFRNCKIYASPTTTSTSYAFNKMSGSTCDNIRLIGNLISGGYYGIYFYGVGTGTGGYNTNIYMDSNVIEKAYYQSHYLYYNDLKSFSYNKIYPRNGNNYHYMYFYYTNHYHTVGNTWDLSKTNTEYGYIYYYYTQYYNHNADALIANNEVILSPSSIGGYGMYLAYTNGIVKVYHNSILSPGSSSYGIYVNCSTGTGTYEIMNNNIWSNYYPIYKTGTAITCVSDYNNLYSTGAYVGYFNKACTSLSAWATESGDVTSVSVAPQFLDSTVSLELATASGLGCPQLQGIMDDKIGVSRNTTTAMGCYEFDPKSYDVSPRLVTAPTGTLITGTPYQTSINVANYGTTTITSMDIYWSVNGVSQLTYSWTGSLAPLAVSSINIGSFLPTTGTNTVKIWTNSPNAQTDERPSNDTLITSFTACDSLLTGTYTLGNGGTFADMNALMAAVSGCGIGGPVVIQLLPGKYSEMVFNGTIPGADSIKTLTFTSYHQNPDSVIIESLTGNSASLILDGGVSYLIFDKLTLQGSLIAGANISASVEIKNCEHIIIKNCNITAFRGSGYKSFGLYCDGGDFTDLIIHNNYIHAVLPVYMYTRNGGTHLELNYNKIIGFDQVLYLDNIDFDEIMYNKILFDSSSTNTYLNLIVMYGNYSNSNHPDTMKFVGNTMRYDGNAYLQDVYMDVYDLYPKHAFIMANNEFMLTQVTGSTYAYWEYIDYMCFINNSILNENQSGNFYLYSNSLVFKNNNIVNTGSGSLVTLNGSISESDYNNLYASNFSLSDWQTYTGQDTHSVSINPFYADLSLGLNLLDDGGLECPRDTLVMLDIEESLRNSLTSMGAYQVIAVNNNLTPRAFVSPTGVSITGTSTPVTLTVLNAGLNTVTSFDVHWKVNGVEQAVYPWTGSLASKSTVNINLGNFIPLSDTNIIEVYTSYPNGVADAVPMNDTLRFYTKGCDSLLYGTYIVNNDTSLADILDKLMSCGVSGAVEIQLAAGVYSPIALTSEFLGTSTTDRVTFISLDKDADSVIFRSNSGPALTLNKLNNVTFEKLSFDASAIEAYTVHFVGNCNNITFYDNIILANPSTSSSTSAAVYKTTSAGVVNDISFIKNQIDGGYYGLHFYAGTGTNAYGKNIVMDSNIITNQYYYAIMLYYSSFESISHNLILSRENNANTYWYGLYSYYTNQKKTNANRIIQRSTSITYPNGIYSNYTNYSSYSTGTALFSNNEVVLWTSSTYYGMYIYYSTAQIYHNSVLMQGSGAARGLYLGGTDPVDVRNNIFVTPSNGHPIYMGTAAQPFTADYNNYYGGSYIGYNNGNITTLAAWRTTTGQDAHSVKISPSFKMTDSAYLDLYSVAGMYCPIVTQVTTDITGIGRYGLTAMGAYTNKPLALDAAIIDIVDWNAASVIGANTPVKAVLMNLSSVDTLRSVSIEWSVRGTNQTPYTWTGSLLQYETDTVLLGNFLPIGGINNVRAWTSNPNAKMDLEPANDTCSVTTYGCDSLLHGIYTIGGAGADFVTMADAVLALEKCGVNGPTEMRINPGTYGQVLFSGTVFGSSAVNTITFTSSTGVASDVILTGSPALGMTGTSNMNFRYLTFGNGTGTYAVTMMGKCDNIEFYHCTMELSSTATASGTYVFYRPASSTCDNFRFIGNTVIGGYYGMYFYGQNTNAGGYNTNVTIDSNVFRDAYYYGYYFYYNDFLSFSYNTTTPRNSSTTTFYTQTYYSNHNYSVGNKWNFTNNTTINNYYNYMYYSHYYNYTGKGYFANNEIIHKSNTAGYGMYFYYSKVDVYHNSVISTGPTAYSFYVNGNNNEMDFKNNQMIAMNIPIIVYQGSNIDFDYNNYYSYSGIIGQWEGTSYFTLNDWIAKSGDSNAISIAPVFIDSTKSLELVNYTGMATPRLPNVLEDIHGSSRSSVTTIGAYGLSVYEGYNLSVDEITEPSLISVVKCYPDFSTVKATLYNGGTLPVDLSVNPVTLHVDVSGAMTYQMDTILSVGMLESMSKDTITLTHMMPTSATGNYDIKVWLTFGLDTKSDDDTAYSSYLVERVTLPYDVYFDSIPQEMAFQQIQGKVGFEVVDTSGMILPPFYGTGRLAFKSSTGLASMARSFIKQVDLQGTSKPTLNFWYQHDNQNPDKPDQMDVIVSTDGGSTFTYLYTVERYDPTLSGTSWKLHQVDLSYYIQSTCLIVGFEALSFGGGDQFIDRIFLEVQQDLVPTEIRLPSDLYACDLTNKPIEVIVANTTVYAVEMDKDTINLTVEITTPDSNTQVSTYRFLGKIPPMSSDTILVHPVFDFSQAGTYNIKAYIDTIKITTDVSNDTITRIIEVHPDVSLQSLENMGNKRIGDTVYAKVSIKNTGDLLIPETPLRLQINNSNDIVETLQTPLYPGDSIEYIFTQPYIVPEVNTVQPYYQISVATELSCDYMASNNKATLIAGVSVVELQVLSIETPDPLVCDTGFSYVYPSIQLSNNGHNDLENVRIYVKVDSASMEVSKISEVFASVPVGAQVYTFTTPYPVPNLTGNYEVTVFIDKVTGEMDDSNDTLSMEACAIEFGTAVPGYDASANWTMGQNMPNPASAATQITYSIPQEGVIRFTITTITGQILYSRDIPSAAGSHCLEFDTQHLAGGIYYYSMEYHGQRIIKKMTIQQ